MSDEVTCDNEIRGLVEERSYFCARPLGHDGWHSLDAVPGPSSMKWLANRARKETRADELAAALARAEVAERECADLHDALDKARRLIDDALASVRRRDQTAGWAQAAAAVAGASGRPAPYPVDLYPGCPCYTCDSETWTQRKWPERMSLCPTCGNKRCPGSAHHDRHAPEEPLAAWELDLLKPLPRD